MKHDNAVYLIPFSHLDLFWAGSREECLSRGAEIIQTALRLLDQFPEYRFMIEAVNFLEYFRAAFPEMIPALERHVASGRLEVIPMRSIIYTQLPSGETLVRNFLYGRELCERWFGFSGGTATLSDIPGITPQLPQITVKSGFSGVLLSHGCPPHTDCVIYEAPDGSGQRAYAPVHYGRAWKLFARGADYSGMCGNEPEIEAEFRGADGPQLCQFGADLCVISEDAVRNFRRWNAGGHRPFLFCTPSEYFRNAFSRFPKHVSGEIPSLWPNVESSWPDLWPLDLPAEHAVFLAEFFGSFRPDAYPRDLMKQVWFWLLDAMDHNQNGIGGEAADAEKLALKKTALLAAERVAHDSAMILAAGAQAPRPNCFPMVVFNRLSWSRRELVRARTSLYGAETAKLPELRTNNFRLVDDAGKELPFRLVRHLQAVADSVEVEFTAEVPAFGARVYFLEPLPPSSAFSIPFHLSDGDERDRENPNTEAGMTSLENSFFRLDVDRVSGSVTLFDKAGGCVLFRNAGIVGMEECRGDYICSMRLNGWVVPCVAERIAVEEISPVAACVRICGSVYGMEFEQRWKLSADVPELEMTNVIHWKCGHYVRLEQTFPFPDDSEYTVEYGVPFGRVVYPETIYKDGIAFEKIVTPERGGDPDREIERIRLVSQWVSFCADGRGATVGCDHRMWEFDRHEVRSCMIRGIGHCSGSIEVMADGSRRAVRRPPDGVYTFRYRISPGCRPQSGWELNAPLYPVGVGRCRLGGTAGLNLPLSLPDTAGTTVAGTCVKPAERWHGAVVVRLFENSGKEAELFLPENPGREWIETDLMERNPAPAGNPVRFKPFEIKTLVLRRKERCGNETCHDASRP